MLKTYELKNAKMVWSKEDIAYQEVLDEFENADYILVVTFNVSEKQEQLIKYLEKVNEETPIQIFTNIPQRYERYYNDLVRKQAKKKINAYIKRLNPENFGKISETYFCFDNHAKIIMTDKIAYIGSANYSDESKKNYEAGVISTDVELIEFVKTEIVSDLISSSESYYSGDTLYYIVTLAMLTSRLVDAEERIYYSCFSTFEHAGREYGDYYDTANNSLSIIELDYLENVILDLQDLLKELIDKLSDSNILTEEMQEEISELDFDNIRNFYSNDTNIWNLASFDITDFAMDYIQEHSLEADTENLARIADIGSQQGFEYGEELAQIAQEDVLYILDSLKIFKDKLNEIIEEIPRGKLNKEIDNTF
ncbi:phospholipase D-like domain-containing protein [Metaplanococcus flavidus]|uniref:Phospholipase D-like domain-containing protein n=1 Tax=Metaplanococcus flavidus TaxID=569883 RepID=A0ABW3LGQ2_9BACL